MVVSEKILKRIVEAVDMFGRFVDQLQQAPTRERAEITYLEGRAAFAKVFPDWEEFLDAYPESFAKLIAEHERSAHLMEELASTDKFAEHCYQCVMCQIDALRALSESRDADAAVEAIRRIPGLDENQTWAAQPRQSGSGIKRRFAIEPVS